MLVAPFGIDLPQAPRMAHRTPGSPYFVCIGTIEPRKNHLLLLNLWRQLAAERGALAPRLVLIGQRGWETGSAIDMLDRCPALRGLVIERNHLADSEMTRLLDRGARAVLPSFAEGFGFPMIEALGLGVPVLCSDLAALRENGGEVAGISRSARRPRLARGDPRLSAATISPRRQRQLPASTGWTATGWADHFAAVDALIAQIAAEARPDDRADSACRAGANVRKMPRCRDGGRSRPSRSVSEGTRRLSSTQDAHASRICSSLCAAVRKNRSRAARSGTAG